MSHACPECDREFQNRLALSMHFSHIHKGKLPPIELDPKQYPFLCSICNERRFKSERGLSYHVSRTHKIRLSKEEKQQRYAETSKSRNIHKRKEQPKLYPHKCPFCEFRSLSTGGLSLHMTKTHPNRIYFNRPVRVGFSADKTSKRCSTQYNEETIEWLDHLSNKNLLALFLSSDNRTNDGLLPSLKRNKIMNNNWRWKKGHMKKKRVLNLTTYGEELLMELREEGKLSARSCRIY